MCRMLFNWAKAIYLERGDSRRASWFGEGIKRSPVARFIVCPCLSAIIGFYVLAYFFLLEAAAQRTPRGRGGYCFPIDIFVAHISNCTVSNLGSNSWYYSRIIFLAFIKGRPSLSPHLGSEWPPATTALFTVSFHHFQSSYQKACFKRLISMGIIWQRLWLQQVLSGPLQWIAFCH